MKQIIILTGCILSTILVEAQTCASNITITGAYSQPLTQSQTWIKATGQTSVLYTAAIKWDAHPTNGFVELKPSTTSDFFVSTPIIGTSAFIAQALDGCGIGVPSIASAKQTTTDVISKERFTPSAIESIVYPNPATESFLVTTAYDLTDATIELFDITGKNQSIIIQSINNNSREIKLKKLSKGTYLLRMTTNTKIESVKINIQ